MKVDTMGRRHSRCQALIAVPVRFWLKAWPRGDCWEWRGDRQRQGYGLFDMMHGVSVLAHRLAYEFSKGPIPTGHIVHHICVHPWCVRPSHLLALPAAEHYKYDDTLTLRYKKRTHCQRGHEFSPDNTWFPRPGTRRCRQCDRLRAQRCRENRKSA